VFGHNQATVVIKYEEACMQSRNLKAQVYKKNAYSYLFTLVIKTAYLNEKCKSLAIFA